MSLRELKKSRTRSEIQRQAVRLFREQGFADTTVEQIAAAAETSPSTVFRYFAKKEDMVLLDGLDEVLIERFLAQPAELSLLQAFRRAFAETLGRISAEELATKQERQALVLTVPELWGASLERISALRQTLVDLVRRRSGRPADDPFVRGVAGAVFGVLLSVWFELAAEPDLAPLRTLDEALTSLETVGPHE